MLRDFSELVGEAAGGLRRLGALDGLNECRQQCGVLIDVREPSEHKELAMNSAVNIPRGVLEIKLPQLHPDAETPIYLHCAGGGRATMAAEQLCRLGYTNVTALACKIDELKSFD